MLKRVLAPGAPDVQSVVWFGVQPVPSGKAIVYNKPDAYPGDLENPEFREASLFMDTLARNPVRVITPPEHPETLPAPFFVSMDRFAIAPAQAALCTMGLSSCVGLVLYNQQGHYMAHIPPCLSEQGIADSLASARARGIDPHAPETSVLLCEGTRRGFALLATYRVLKRQNLLNRVKLVNLPRQPSVREECPGIVVWNNRIFPCHDRRKRLAVITTQVEGMFLERLDVSPVSVN